MEKPNLTAVVAGVGPALGASICRTLADKNYYVFALSRSTEFTESLAKEDRTN